MIGRPEKTFVAAKTRLQGNHDQFFTEDSQMVQHRTHLTTRNFDKAGQGTYTLLAHQGSVTE